ncbi:relaxase/mobilization nuclease domain-containing protein [Phocaeicola vulgatus]|nr:relaxase/mobilization nuclease domain-containing protein [Phocaeicola vulgatus]
MIAKGKSISHGTAALEYDLAKEINGEAAATEIHRHELFGCTGEEMVQEMKPYFVDFPNVKNNCLRFEVSPSVEESAGMTDADWAKLGNDFMQRMGLMNHQYIIVKHSGTEKNRRQAHLHILANRVSLSGELYKDNWIGKRASPSVEESAGMTDADWAKLGNDFMQRMGLMNHQYIIVKHSGTEKNSRQAHLHILANRVSLSGELYKDNWIGKRATEAANSIARERNLVQSKDIGKANREEIKQAMDGILARMQGFDLAGFSRELEKLGFRVREARASTGKLNGYYVTSRSGTEYKASEIGKGYTLAHIEKTQKNLKYNSISRNYGNTLKPKDGGLHL